MLVLLIVAAVSVVSLLSFVGALFLGFNESLLQRFLTVFVSFASGSLLGGALFHMVPQALDEKLPIDIVSQLLVFGILLFFVMEKFLYWRHCHEKTCDVHMFAYLNLFGDSIHNFVDGNSPGIAINVGAQILRIRSSS